MEVLLVHILHSPLILPTFALLDAHLCFQMFHLCWSSAGLQVLVLHSPLILPAFALHMHTSASFLQGSQWLLTQQQDPLLLPPVIGLATVMSSGPPAWLFPLSSWYLGFAVRCAVSLPYPRERLTLALPTLPCGLSPAIKLFVYVGRREGPLQLLCNLRFS